MMALAARDAMALDQIEAIADKVYYKSEEILTCEEAGIAVVVPKPQTSKAGSRGQFDKVDFAYDAENDVYICPAGEKLIYRFTGPQDDEAIRVYWSSKSADSVINDKCTNSKQRRDRRWEHEDVLKEVQYRLDHDPAQLAVRSMTVEHPYGKFKSWMGATQFRMRRSKNVATEMALHVLAYNIAQVMKIIGIPVSVAAMKA